MKTIPKLSVILILLLSCFHSYSQEIKTLFKKDGTNSHGGYGAISNKFTRIGGDFANLAEIYGGWYINHKFTLGLSGAAVTNNLHVPEQYRAVPGEELSYQYAQFGLFTEYVLASNNVVHLTAQLTSGAGFTTQYQRYNWDDQDEYDYDDGDIHDMNWFTIIEPGVNVEFNVLKWMRFCTGVSYRASFGSNGLGLKDKDISGVSLNAGFKFGKF
ncbi:MAG TPA: hypothetical protein VIT44_03245 [Cyclobacteriaceae bacterium]